MKKLGTYSCDTASLVINGVRISNGNGDGYYDIYYFENKEEAEKNRLQRNKQQLLD